MITIYITDEIGVFVAAATVSRYAPMPKNGTLTAPPATTGEEVAQWRGGQWHVLAGRPPPPPAPPATLEELKARRAQAVDAIKVATAAGNVFDGDEVSQGRMSRAILVLAATGGTVPWVLADNSIAQVGAAELTEALALAGAQQAALWVEPYTV